MPIPIQDALFRQAHLLTGRIDGAEASKRVDELLAEAECSPEEMRAFWESPEMSLGPFKDLPPLIRQGLAEAALFYFLESYSLSSPILEKIVHGTRSRIGYGLIKLGWILYHRLNIKPGSLALRLGRRLVTSARARGRQRLSRIRFTNRYRLPLAYAIWIRCQVDVLGLIQDYIEEIPVDRRIGPIWHDPGLNSESCMLIGVDTIMHQGRICFVESNMNPGFHADRIAVYPEGDPIFRSLADYAVQNGYARIVFCPTNVTGERFKITDLLEIELERAWRTMADEYGLELDIIDAPILGSPYSRKAEMFIPEDTRDSLFVNVRALDNPLSRLLGTGEMDTRLEVLNRDREPSAEILVPRRIRHDRELPPPDLNPRFPNIIVKDAHLDATVGIEIHKCDNLPEDANSGSQQAYEFIVPDRESRFVDGKPEEFVCIFRTHILLTHRGARFLATRKDISPVPVPESLEMGRVLNKRGYITNLHLDAVTVPATDDETTAHQGFAEAVSTCIYEVFRNKMGPFA